jgi:hypothetical protein
MNNGGKVRTILREGSRDFHSLSGHEEGSNLSAAAAAPMVIVTFMCLQ